MKPQLPSKHKALGDCFTEMQNTTTNACTSSNHLCTLHTRCKSKQMAKCEWDGVFGEPIETPQGSDGVSRRSVAHQTSNFGDLARTRVEQTTFDRSSQLSLYDRRSVAME